MQATKSIARKVWTFVSNTAIAIVVIPFSFVMGIVVGACAGLASFMGSLTVSLAMGITTAMGRMRKAVGEDATVHTTAQIFNIRPAAV